RSSTVQPWRRSRSSSRSYAVVYSVISAIQLCCGACGSGTPFVQFVDAPDAVGLLGPHGVGVGFRVGCGMEDRAVVEALFRAVRAVVGDDMACRDALFKLTQLLRHLGGH